MLCAAVFEGCVLLGCINWQSCWGKLLVKCLRSPSCCWYLEGVGIVNRVDGPASVRGELRRIIVREQPPIEALGCCVSPNSVGHCVGKGSEPIEKDNYHW